MAKEKRKNGTGQNRALPLIAGSVLSYAIAWGGSRLLVQWVSRLTHLTMKQTHAISFTILCLFIAMIQVQLVERLLRRSMRGWMLYTFLGVLLTLPLYRNDPEWPTYASIFLTPLLPVALIQTVWLSRRVRWARLWPIAAVVSLVASIVSLNFYRGGFDTSLSHLLMGLPYGLIQGVVMRSLWTQAEAIEKAKNNFETDEDDRLSHLQDDESTEVAHGDMENRAAKKKAW